MASILTPSPSSSTPGHHHHHHHHRKVTLCPSGAKADNGFIRVADSGPMSLAGHPASHPSLDHHYANLLFNGTSHNHYQTSAASTAPSNCQKLLLQQQQLPVSLTGNSSSFPSSSSASAAALPSPSSLSSSSSSQSSGISSLLSSQSSSQSSFASSSHLSSPASPSSSSQSSSNYNLKRFTPKACSSKQLSPSTFNSGNVSKLNQVIKESKSKRNPVCHHQKVQPPFPNEVQNEDGAESDAENYERISEIGAGTYGVVFKARDLRSKDHKNQSTANEVVAMKRVTVPCHEEEGIPIGLLREIALLKSLESYSHPNIVKLLDICTGKRLRREKFHLYLIFEHVEQDLAAYLENCPSPGLCPSRIKEIAFFILKGIDFLHSNRIVHRDLKPSNVLVAKSGQIKLADFGLARIYESSVSLTTTVVTLWYRSPEVLLRTSYASSVDIWSIGCIFAELFTRQALIPGRSEAEQLQKIFQLIGSPPAKHWPEDCTIRYEIVSKFKPTPIENTRSQHLSTREGTGSENADIQSEGTSIRKRCPQLRLLRRVHKSPAILRGAWTLFWSGNQTKTRQCHEGKISKEVWRWLNGSC